MSKISISRHQGAWLLLAACVGVGCGGEAATYPVHGRVTLDGQPVPVGFVMFESIPSGEATKSFTARGAIDTDGNFTLTTFGENDGAVVGVHRVAVIANHYSSPESGLPSGSVVPIHYNSTAQSGIERTVAADRNEINLELTSAP